MSTEASTCPYQPGRATDLLLLASSHHALFKVQGRNKGWLQLDDSRPSLVSQKNEICLDNVVRPVLAPGYKIAEALAVHELRVSQSIVGKLVDITYHLEHSLHAVSCLA